MSASSRTDPAPAGGPSASAQRLRVASPRAAGLPVVADRGRFPLVGQDTHGGPSVLYTFLTRPMLKCSRWTAHQAIASAWREGGSCLAFPRSRPRRLSRREDVTGPASPGVSDRAATELRTRILGHVQ